VAGEAENNTFAFTTTVVVDDVDRFLDDEAHTGRLIGTADCPALSSEPLDAFAGTFNLMRPDPEAVDTRRFDYKMVLSTKAGEQFLFCGHKVVRSDAGLDLWDDTTTLFVDILRGAEGRDGLVAKGILRIDPDDFARQLRTFRSSHGRHPVRRLEATAKFGKLFAGSLFDVYGGIFAPTDRYDATEPRRKRELRVPEPHVHYVQTEDGKTLRLLRYAGGSKGPVMLSHGLGVSGKIFSLDTIDTNVVEYLCTAEYDCWVLDFRASIDLPYARDQWSGDEIAQYDYPAAVNFIREATNQRDIQILAHCFGSTTFFMAMLTGLEGVRSAVVSQIATDVVVPWWPQRLLAHLRTPSLFDTLGIKTVNARAEEQDKAWEQWLDWLIRTIAPIPREEKTTNATSNRIAVLYGPLYELDQLNPATLKWGLPETFGHANITAFKHLARIARQQSLVGADGDDIYMLHLERLAIPIHFIHGAENACFDPVSTQRTVDRLSKANGANLYSRSVIPGYGHIDCIFGKNAARDVYPEIVQHLEKTAQG
ncbi:MAG: alpha/beta hydrolase, partial [Hyphomicrobiaceae bacterium]